MLKKLLTGCLTIAMVTALSATAMAEAKVSGKTRAYFGQYQPAGEDIGARFANVAEGNIGVMGTVGDITGFMEVEVREGGSAASEFKATKAWVQMQKDALSLKIGNDANGETVTMQAVGKSSSLAAVGGAWADGSPTVGSYKEDDHLKVGYKVGDLDLGLSLYSWTGTESSTQLTVGGGVGPIKLKVASTTTSKDDPDTTDTEKGSESVLHFGVLYPIGAMALSLDYTTNAGKDSADVEYGATYMRLAFSMSGAGPGAISALYDSLATTADGEAVSTTTWLNLGYDLPMGQGSGLEILYLTSTTTFEDSSIDALTDSFIGLGLYAFF